jgi:hypothetical protein
MSRTGPPHIDSVAREISASASLPPLVMISRTISVTGATVTAGSIGSSIVVD